MLKSSFSPQPKTRLSRPLAIAALLFFCGAGSPSQTAQAPQSQEQPERVQITSQSMASMFSLLEDHQYLQLEEQLRTAPDSPETRYLRGILLNRSNKPADSMTLLEPLAEEFEKSGDAAKAQELRRTLAEDYLRTENFAKAKEAYALLASRYGKSLSEEEKEEMEQPLALLPLLASAPAQVVDAPENFRIPTTRDSLGMTETGVFIDGIPRQWIVDPSSPFNYLSRSTAKLIGLKISEAAATVTGLRGNKIPVHTSLIPRLKIGAVTIRNVSVVVFEDGDLYYPKTSFQVEGILGFPLFTALGSVTIYPDDSIEASKKDPQGEGSSFYIDGQRLLAALGPRDHQRIYEIDTAGQQTFLSSRYYDEHRDDFEGKKTQLLAVPGAEDAPPAPAYVADTVRIPCGNDSMDLADIQILTQPRGKDFDDTYGTLGVYALDQLASYTFDYRTMKFYTRMTSDTHLRGGIN